MDGKVVNLGRFCRHGAPVTGCQICHGEAQLREALNELEAQQNRNTALNQQNISMWYALQQIAEQGDPRARKVLEELAKGTTFRGTDV